MKIGTPQNYNLLIYFHPKIKTGTEKLKLKNKRDQTALKTETFF